VTERFTLKREFSMGDLIAIITALVAVMGAYFQTKSMVDILDVRVTRMEREDRETLKALEIKMGEQAEEVVEIRTDVRWIRGAIEDLGRE